MITPLKRVFRLAKRTEKFCDLLDELCELEFGEFLMVQSKGMLTIYKEADQFDET